MLAALALLGRQSQHQNYRVLNYEASELRQRIPSLECEVISVTNSLQFRGGPEVLEQLQKLDQPSKFGLVA